MHLRNDHRHLNRIAQFTSTSEIKALTATEVKINKIASPELLWFGLTYPRTYG